MSDIVLTNDVSLTVVPALGSRGFGTPTALDLSIARPTELFARDLDQDGYFVKKAALREVKQWLRAIDAHLVPNRPRGADGLDLVTFTLGPRTGRYLTARSWLHCAIATVADRHGRRDPKLIHRVRLRYIAALPCDRCRDRTAAVSHPRSQEGAKETDSVRVTNGEGREALEEVLHAAGSQSRKGVGD